MEPTPFSVARIAEATGQSTRTVQRHIAEGALHAVKLGPATSAWIIPADEAQRYIAEHTEQDGAA